MCILTVFIDIMCKYGKVAMVFYIIWHIKGWERPSENAKESLWSRRRHCNYVYRSDQFTNYKVANGPRLNFGIDSQQSLKFGGIRQGKPGRHCTD